MLIAFLGAAVGIHENTHLSVTILRTSVPKRVRSALVVTSDVILCVFGAYMCWYGTKLTLFKWDSLIPLINVPEGLRSLPLSVGGGLIVLFTLGHLFRVALGVDRRSDEIQ